MPSQLIDMITISEMLVNFHGNAAVFYLDGYPHGFFLTQPQILTYAFSVELMEDAQWMPPLSFSLFD